MSKYQSSNIYEISLADALEFVVDNRGKTVPTDDKGIALIATNCISNDHIYPQKQNLRYVSQDIFDNWFRAHPKPGDIILTNKGSNNGEVCLVPNTVDFCIAQDMVAVRADKKKIDPLYLFAALRSRIVQKRIKYLNVDAVIPHFKKTDFNKLLIPLPDRKSQEFIGKIYFNFSIKIDNLRRQNETLETIAQTLFKHWFIDFEFPNDDGKPYKSSGGAMVASELGDIPAGWRVITLKECLQHLIDNRGKTPKFFSSGIPALSAKFIKGGTLVNQENFNYISLDLFASSEKLQPGDIIMTSEAPLGELYYISKNTNYYPAQRVFALRANQKVVLSAYLNYWLGSSLGQFLINRRATGSTVQGIKQTELYQCEVLLPQRELMENFSHCFNKVLYKKELNEKQIQTLTKTRDTLLPKLMSGQIRVKEVESIIEEVK